MGKSTIYDDVFMTICERMPQLLIPLINEAFGTDYSEDEKIVSLRDEHHLLEKKIITDAFVRIRNDRYHIECQSNDHVCMITRMFEYDTVIALESKRDDKDYIEIEFPKSCVVYLKGSNKASRRKVLRLKFPDDSVFEYRPEIIEVAAYSLDEMFDKRLLMMLPFYLVRYEKVLKKDDPDSSELRELLKETKEMIDRLEDQIGRDINNDIDLVGLIRRIANYLCRTADKTKERIGDAMGGKVLELESDRLRAEGRSIGHAEGLAIGHAEGHAEGLAEVLVEGRAEGSIKTLAGLVQDGLIDTKIAAKRMGVSVKKFKEMAAAQSFVL